ncbi:MAG: ATP-binding protein, partial [Nanoarchaeota archaeon]|nr:ATP-binding protein [Nanoarchaeota archaeon]
QMILKLIKKGESEKLEFKETIRLNIHTNSYDKQMGHSVLKSITAFLNTKGGILLVGVSDEGIIKGIEREDFKNNDKFLLYFNNLFKKHIGNEFIPFISYDIIKINNKSIFKIECKKSNKEVFLKDGNLEEFFIRTGPASVLIEGSKLIEYIQRRFR